MRRLLPFVLVVSAILVIGYGYIATRRHAAGAHSPAPRGRERIAPPLVGCGLPGVEGFEERAS